jgi:hypothetical protein
MTDEVRRQWVAGAKGGFFMASTRTRRGAWLAAATAAVALSGCTALTRQVLVDERAKPEAPVVSHCAGSEWTDNSMMAIVPIPIIGLGMPTQEINEIKADDVLSKCGPRDRLANERVEVDRTACVPTVLTRVISFGVWQWCPAKVSWQADVMAPAPERTTAAPAAMAPVQAVPMNDFNVPSSRLTTGNR